MFVLGLILILVSAGALVAVLASGTDDSAALYGGSVSMPTLVVFLLGAAALLLFVIGLELVRSGVKRANQNRRDKRRLRKLERREELRRDDQSESGTPTATDSGTHRTAGDESVRQPETSDGGGTGTVGTSTTQPPTETDTNGGPYQAPPPPSR